MASTEPSIYNSYVTALSNPLNIVIQWVELAKLQ